MSEPYIIPAETVDSSNIAAIGYDNEKRVLAITFKSGDVFHYAGIGPDLALEFYQAESKGRFYTQRLKGKFTGQKMTGSCPKCGDEHGYIGATCSDCGCAQYVEVQKKAKAS